MTHLKKIYKLIREDEVKFKIDWLDKDYGLHVTDGENTTITVNLYDLMLECLIHECLHDIYPELTDKDDQTDKMALRILNKMTQKQKAYLFRKFMAVVELPKRRIVKKL